MFLALDPSRITNAGIAFICWSFMASAGYIFNDIMDIENDRNHPIKKNRPIASGDVSIKIAIVMAVLLMIISMVGAWYISLSGFIVLMTYTIVNWLYTIHLKKLRYLDIMILCLFYLLRLIMGGVVTEVELTPWFMITSTFVFLALSTHKRKMECDVIKEGKLSGRKYTVSDSQFLNIASIVLAFIAVVFLNLHSILVLNLVAYWEIIPTNLLSVYIVFQFFDGAENKVDDPVEKLLKSKEILIAIIIYITLYSIFLSR